MNYDDKLKRIIEQHTVSHDNEMAIWDAVQEWYKSLNAAKPVVSGSSKRKPSKETLGYIADDLAFKIVDHSIDEISEPEQFANVIKKYLVKSKSW